MPPSIADMRQSPQPLTTHDDATQSQPVRDFHARQKLLSSYGSNEQQRTTGKKSTTSKRPTNKAKNDKKKKSSGTTQEVVTGTAEESFASPSTANALDTSSSAGAGYGGMNTMGALGGMGMGYGMYGGGMMGSPYGMGMGGMMMGAGPLNTLNQFLFGVQTAIYSLSSAVQVIGMNTQAMHQLLDAASKMIDHALATWHEMRALEANANELETEEQKMRRRRLKALRWALVVAATYAAYKIIRNLVSSRQRDRRRRRRLTADPYSSNAYASGSGYGAFSSYPQPSIYTPPYSSNGAGMNMYGGYGSGLSYGGSFY